MWCSEVVGSYPCSFRESFCFLFNPRGYEDLCEATVIYIDVTLFPTKRNIYINVIENLTSLAKQSSRELVILCFGFCKRIQEM